MNVEKGAVMASNSSSKGKISFTYNAPATLTFAFVSLVVLLVGYLTGGKSTELFFEVYRSKLSVGFFIRLFGHWPICRYCAKPYLIKTPQILS